LTISRPTAPVAPTTATRNPVLGFVCCADIGIALPFLWAEVPNKKGLSDPGEAFGISLR
jgi:hypothetical protein